VKNIGKKEVITTMAKEEFAQSMKAQDQVARRRDAGSGLSMPHPMGEEDAGGNG
jgi:mannitol/fructose-specific phosphotransferase system IIA component